jgi:suppressor of ftsI
MSFRAASLFLTVMFVASAPNAPQPISRPDIFPSIPEVRSVRGVASVSLDVVLDPVDGKPTFEYGGIAGVVPTIRVEPGDRIALTVHDALPMTKGQSSDVNVHFHGLIVSPDAPGDEVLRTIAHSGGTVHYLIRIPPDHEPGLYWYHPHVHGATYAQVTNGMSGAIVVEGLQQHLPILQAMRERIIVLRDVPIGPNAVDEDMPMTGMAGMNGTSPAKRASAAPRKATNAANPCRAESALQPTLNRQLHAHIGIRPGERQLFRVVNASASRYFDLSVDGSTLGLVARDGVPLDAYPGTPPLEIVQHLLLPPASRAEFIVTGSAHPSKLRSACFNSGPTGDADPAVDLATLVDPGANDAESSAPLEVRVGRPLPANVLSQPLPPPAATRTIRFTEDADGFYLNGKAFAMGDRPAIVARSGTVEAWTLLNETDEVHDFHIHQVHFATTSLDGVPVRPRIWSDTVNVPPRRRLADGRYLAGNAKIIVDFRDPVVRGTFVYHCHILDHEDQGMMAVIKVI